jgi:hypothetical protein
VKKRVKAKTGDDVEFIENWSGSRRILYTPVSQDEVYIALTMLHSDEIGRQVPIDRDTWKKSFPHLSDLIDRFIDTLAWAARQVAGVDAWIDRTLVDGLVNATASATWTLGNELKRLQTGSLRQYVTFIVVGTVALFVIASLFFRQALAG